MKLYNSMTRKKEEFVPLEPGKVKMYCVQLFPHRQRAPVHYF